MLCDIFFNLRDFALVLSLFLLFLVDVVGQVLNLLLDFPDFLFGHVGFGLQVHFEFLVLLLVFLESFLPLIKFVLLHGDVLVQQLCLLRFLVYLNLSHEYFARVINEVPNGLFLLPTLVQILIRVGSTCITPDRLKS